MPRLCEWKSDLSEFLGLLGDLLSSGGLEVVGHSRVEGEDGCRRTDLCAHVANGAHAGAGDGVDAVTVVFNDGPTKVYVVEKLIGNKNLNVSWWLLLSMRLKFFNNSL